MAIAYDNANSVQGNSVSALTIPAFAVAGNFIFVGAGGDEGPPPPTVSSIVRNGTETFTPIWSYVDLHAAKQRSTGSYYVTPAAGSYSIVVTFSGAYSEGCEAGAVSLSGVDTASPIGVPVNAEGFSGTATVTVAATDTQWLIDFVQTWGHTMTVGADQDQRWNQDGSKDGTWTAGACSTQPGTVAGDVMSWTIGSGSADWATGAVPINEGAGGGPRKWFFGRIS